MRNEIHPVLEKGRTTSGRYATESGSGLTGAYLVPCNGIKLVIICGVGEGWQHVSVSPRRKNRVPTWAEMCFVKALFWEASERVMQFHPAESEYVNDHDYVLHLWRPIGGRFPTPDRSMV